MKTRSELIESAMRKYPKARRIAVENFTSGYDSWDMAAHMNLDADAHVYKWNSNTISAIKYVIRGGPR